MSNLVFFHNLVKFGVSFSYFWGFECVYIQASTLTQNVTVDVGPVKHVASTGPAKSLLFYNIFKKKNCIKFTDNVYFYLFYLHLFQEHLGTFLREN